MSNNPPQANPTELVDVEDMDTMMRLLVGWHANKVAVCNHMKGIPDGTEVSIEGGETMVLSGEALKAFQFGLAYALSELAPLPFVATVETEDGHVERTSVSQAIGASQH